MPAVKHSSILVLFLTCFLTLPELSAQDWIPVSRDQFIEVFTRESDESPIREVRIKAYFNAPVSSLVSVLNDVEGYKEWVYRCKVAHRVKTISKENYVYYTESKLPMPLSNRDFILHSRQWVDEATGITYLESVGQSGFLEEKEGIVRVTDFRSQWAIQAIDDKHCQIDYTVRADPAGSIPSWLTNMVITLGPVETMTNLKRKVEQHHELLTQRLRK